MWSWFMSLFRSSPTVTPAPAPTPRPSGGGAGGGVWQIRFSSGVPTSLKANADGSQYFDAPVAPGSVHYITKPSTPIKVGQTIRMVFLIAGGGKWWATEEKDSVSARVRFMVQQKGDGMTSSEPDKRWWAQAYVELKDGDFALEAPLNGTVWSNVFGKTGTATGGGFATCLNNIGNIGFTFGGMFFGHGVYVEGKARFTLRSFTVT